MYHYYDQKTEKDLFVIDDRPNNSMNIDEITITNIGDDNKLQFVYNGGIIKSHFYMRDMELAKKIFNQKNNKNNIPNLFDKKMKEMNNGQIEHKEKLENIINNIN